MKTVCINSTVWLGTLLALLFISCEKSDTIPSRIASVKVFSSDSQAQNMGITRLNNQSMIVYGYAPGSAGYVGNQVIKCDAEGNQLWVKQIRNEMNEVWKVLPIGESDYVAIGWSTNPQALTVARYTSEGELVWVKNKSYSSDPVSYPITALIDQNGNIVVVAKYQEKLTLIKWNPDGEQFFSRSFTVTVPSSPANTQNPDQFVLVEDEGTGDFFILSTFLYNSDFVGSTRVAYNSLLVRISSLGQSKWVGYKRDSIQSYSTAGIINRGQVVHTFVNVGLEQAGVTPAFAATYGQIHHEQWDSSGAFLSREAIVGLPQNTYFNQVLPTSDGGCLLTGTTNLFSSGYTLNAKMMVVKLDAQFRLEWQKLVNTRSQSFGTQSVEAEGAYFTSGSHVVGNKVQYQMVVKTK